VLKRLLPAALDNTYTGHPLALWLLWVVVAVKFAQIGSVMIDGPGIVSSADGVPLDSFSAAAAQTVLAAFVGMGISRLLIGIICVAVLLRYRSAIAAVFALLALHDLARELVLQPIRVGEPIGPAVNWSLFALTVAGVALSAFTRSQKVEHAGVGHGGR
jgi:hypothetical protein